MAVSLSEGLCGSEGDSLLQDWISLTRNHVRNRTQL